MYSNNIGWYFLLNVYAKFYMKMNEIVNKLFLVGDKFMSEMHLKQPRFTYSTCGPFPENKEFKILKKQEIQAIFLIMNLIRLAFNITWLLDILKT